MLAQATLEIESGLGMAAFIAAKMMAKHELEAADASCKVSVVGLLDRIDHLALYFRRHVGWSGKVQNWRTFGAKDSSLVSGGHVAGAPVFRAADWTCFRIEHDNEARQIFVDAAKPVVYP